MADSTAFHLALQGGEELLAKRVRTTAGIRFPADSETRFRTRYENKLYDGAAGVGIALLDLFLATADDRYKRLSDEVWCGLVESTPENEALPCGLYNGFSGVALFHLARARILGDEEALKYARLLGKRLAESSFIDTDLIRGAAGAGLLQLSLFYATDDRTFLNGAWRAAVFLSETAIRNDAGIYWTVRDPRKPLDPNDNSYEDLAFDPHPGFSHGTAGICFFLVHLAAAIKEPLVVRLYQEGFRWLEANAIRTQGCVNWPRSAAHPVMQNHWCHGSTGIAQAYLALYRNTGEQKPLETALAGGQSTWEAIQSNPEEQACHCHGLAGALDLFLELAGVTGTSVWHERATETGNRLFQKIQDGTHGGKGAGLALGTAGIVRQLLRLAGHPIFPIPEPDREKLILPAKDVPSQEETQQNRNSIRFEPEAADQVPRVAVRFAKVDRYLQLGRPDAYLTRSILQQIENRPVGAAYFQSVHRIRNAFRKFQAAYPNLLSENAFGPQTFGPMLREIAALVLRPSADPQRVVRTARRMTTNAINALTLMMTRLERDQHAALQQDVGGKVTGVEVRKSDPHRGGQQVVALKFEEGPDLLYKSRSVAIDSELAGTGDENVAALCRRWLKPFVSAGVLPTHRIIAADPWYGYVEQIASAAPATLALPFDLIDPERTDTLPLPKVTRLKQEEERRFWYSAGLLAGHAFTFGLHDLHAENVVCGRTLSTPDISLHAVDLEVAFGAVIDLEDTQLLEGPRWGTPAGASHHSHAALHPGISFVCGLHAEEWVIDQSNGSLVSTPWRACRWMFPHVAQNSDNSFGYGNHLCVFLRGFADQWSVLQAHSMEVSERLRFALSGLPARVVFKPTLSYLAALMREKMDGPPIPGAAALQWKLRNALPFIPAELTQLKNLDIPYFFRFLGEEDGSRDGIYWMSGSRYFRARHVPPAKREAFHSIVDRQRDPQRLARAVVDAVWAVAPAGPFDFHEPQLGVRVFRTSEDERLLIAVLLGERYSQRLTCRVSPQGQIEWWFDSPNT